MRRQNLDFAAAAAHIDLMYSPRLPQHLAASPGFTLQLEQPLAVIGFLMSDRGGCT